MSKQKNSAKAQEAYEEADQTKGTKKRRKKRYIILLAAEIFAVLVIAAVAFVYFYSKGIHDQMTSQVDFGSDDIVVNTDEEVASHFNTITEKYTLIMLYGVDARNNDSSDLLKDSNADSEILCCINNETGDVKLVSLHRDTFTKTTTDKKNKLTNIYAAYGVQESLGTINQSLDLNVTKFVTVNWKAVVKTIELLDGLDLELTAGEIRAVNKFGPHTAEVTGYTYHELDPDDAGTIHLDGVQAAAYARVRSVAKENDEGTTEHDDIARASRQRIVITAMLEKLKSEFSLSLVSEIKSEVLPYVATNIDYDEIISMVTNASNYTIGENTMFPFENMYRNQEALTTAYIYADTLTENVAKLHEMLFDMEDYQPSSKVQEISDFITEYRYEHP